MKIQDIRQMTTEELYHELVRLRRHLRPSESGRDAKKKTRRLGKTKRTLLG